MRSIFFRAQIICCCNKIIEDILLMKLRAGIVPILAIFSAAAKIRHRKDNSILEQNQPQCAKGWGQAGIETAVSIKIAGTRSIALEALLADDEHRYFRAVF